MTNEAAKRWRPRNPEKAKESAKRSRAKNPGASKAANRAWYARLKAEVLVAYGGRCSCCGESNPGFLTMDHIHQDGHLERTTGTSGTRQGGSGSALYTQLKKAGFPQGRHQVLCWNCNCGRATNGGVCPHQDCS